MRYIGSGTVCVAVQDSQIPENNDSFAVTFADGRAKSVTRGGEADEKMTVPTFSALIAGVWDFTEAVGHFRDWKSSGRILPESQVFSASPDDCRLFLMMT